MTKQNKSREKLIESASKLFRMYGYHGVSVADIVKESETAKGSLYYYFPNGKEEMVIEAINHTKKLMHDLFQTTTENIKDPILALQSFTNSLAEIFDTNLITGISVATIAGETTLSNEAIRTACLSVFNELNALYKEKFLEMDYSESEAEEAGLIMNAMIEGGSLLAFNKKSGEPLKIIANRIPMLFKK